MGCRHRVGLFGAAFSAIRRGGGARNGAAPRAIAGPARAQLRTCSLGVARVRRGPHHHVISEMLGVEPLNLNHPLPNGLEPCCKVTKEEEEWCEAMIYIYILSLKREEPGGKGFSVESFGSLLPGRETSSNKQNHLHPLGPIGNHRSRSNDRAGDSSPNMA